MTPDRPQSFTFGAYTARRDADSSTWRVFGPGRAPGAGRIEVGSYDGPMAQHDALYVAGAMEQRERAKADPYADLEIAYAEDTSAVSRGALTARRVDDAVVRDRFAGTKDVPDYEGEDNR